MPDFGAARPAEANVPSGNIMVILKVPPSQMVFSFPGMPHSHTLRSMTPWLFLTGLAQKPKGWSRLHCFLGVIQVNVVLSTLDKRLSYRSSPSRI